MLTRRQALFGLTALGLAPRALACGWDRDTLTDEIQRKPARFDLVTGQLPTHSNAWYERTVRESETRRKTHPDDLPAGDDLGMALAHLGRYDEAAAVFELAIARHPERYETLSNLGVVRKKQGRYDEAAGLLKQALRQRPEGHLGIGDWYVRNVRWRARANPQSSFVNVPYASVFREGGRVREYDVMARTTHLELGAAKRAGAEWRLRDGMATGSGLSNPQRESLVARDLDRLERLVRYDRTFTDGLYVLGDLKGDLHFSVIALHRALDLGHPRPDMIRKSLEVAFAHWEAIAAGGIGGTRAGAFPSDFEGSQAFARRADSAAKAWVAAFQKTEAEILATGARPTFEQTEAALERAGVRRSRAPELPDPGGG
jgi:tetratricopeptide (TPR) repeat protein